MIEITARDIFDVRVDALVNPANRQPDFSWGSHITEHLRRHAGTGLLDERKRHGVIELGQAVSTSGGDLPFEHVIHAAVLDKYDFNPLFLVRLRQRTSDETLRSATGNALREAERLGAGSIAFSPMGAGVGAMPMKKCARIMLDTVATHLLDTPDSSLERIVFAVKTEKNRRIFEEVRNPRPTP